MKIKNLAYTFLLLSFLACSTREKNKLELILEGGSKDFQEVLNNPRREVQILYGEIVDDSIIHHTYQLRNDVYFYPASTVKMPVAFAAIKKAQELGISLDSPLIIDSTKIYPRNLHDDAIHGGPITISKLIQSIFTVSDNTAYNILFGWLGKDYINNLYSSIGIDTRIVHQLGENAFSFDPVSNEYSRKAMIVKSGNDTLTFKEQPQKFSPKYSLEKEIKGKGYINAQGNQVSEPFDFSQKNYVSLEGLVTILERALMPEFFSAKQSFDFTDSTELFLVNTMDMLPKNMPAPFDTLPDNYVKFLHYGNASNVDIPSTTKIRNKVGWAYGYLSDVEYFEDTQHDVRFFLAAVIHVNENDIYNDGKYQYKTVGLPFLDELGDLVYAKELNELNRP
ncbi:MAG: serine hydrolase [Cyclobacteriaceae bacterium]